jgi:hypothetical protein
LGWVRAEQTKAQPSLLTLAEALRLTATRPAHVRSALYFIGVLSTASCMASWCLHSWGSGPEQRNLPNRGSSGLDLQYRRRATCGRANLSATPWPEPLARVPWSGFLKLSYATVNQYHVGGAHARTSSFHCPAGAMPLANCRKPTLHLSGAHI